MSQIEQLAKRQSRAPSAYDISREQVEIYPTLSEPEKEGVVLFETLSYHFSSGVIEILARHIPYVDAETQLYIAREIRDESQHFTRCVSSCRSLAITPLDFFPDIRRIYGEHPNWLRYMAGCAFTLEQTAVHVFGKFLSRGSRYFQPVKPFVGEDEDHFSHSLLQMRQAMKLNNTEEATKNRTVIIEAIRESLDCYAPAFFEHITRVITLGTKVTRSEVEEEWRVALRSLKKSCANLELSIEIEPDAWCLHSSRENP
ncbi:MAG TPA: hypothetical protein VJ124_16580 [Pyrinomonadaceae bacterium]|nr:hypothetical protein [Pyrinomonadaceae bacterium]